MADNRNTIVLVGRGMRKSKFAAGAITPGDLIMVDANLKYARHNVAGAITCPIFAVENEVFGNDITVDYASTDECLGEACMSGMEVYATLAANAPAITKGDLLESAGDGTLRKVTSQPADLTIAAGTPAAGTVDVGSSFSQTTLNNNFATIATQLNLLTPQGVGNPIARAMESVDNSSNAAKVHIKCEIV